MKLIDDGTLDTVLRCSCGTELRYTFGEHDDDCLDGSFCKRRCYERFVEWAMRDAQNTHECP